MKKISIVLVSLMLVVMGLISAVYVVNPKLVYRFFRPVLQVLSENLETPSAYNTKYGIHPILLEKVNLVIADAKSEGIDLRVVSGFRDSAKQRMLYNKGRTTKGGVVTNALPGLSYHNWGWAVDVCEFKNGKPNWKSKHWKDIGRIGKKHGLVWGGDWKTLVDKPHLQLSIYDIIINSIF